MTKSKVLVLHGFGSSNAISHRQTPNLRSRLESLGLVVEYPHGPIQLTPKDFPFEDVHDCTAQPLHCWWHFLGESAHSLEPLMQTFEQYPDKDSIVGIIGISQGGATSNVLAANAHRLLPSLKFVVGYGGFLFPTPWNTPEMKVYEDGIHVPYLTVYGSNDTDVTPQASLKVHDLVVKGEKHVIEHDKGHTFADEDERVVAEVIGWIEKFI